MSAAAMVRHFRRPPAASPVWYSPVASLGGGVGRIRTDSGRRGRIAAWLSLVGLATAALGCQTTPGELVPFTESQRLRYQLGAPELRALQYYLSDRIVLERVARQGAGRVKRGRLIVRSGTKIQQVYVERGTPGVLESDAHLGPVEEGPPALEISFERGAPLRFSAAPDGSYSLSAPSGSGLFGGLLWSWSRPRRFEVDFDGEKWTVVDGSESRLLIERDALGRIARTRRILPGVRAPGAR
jgi:hypothetical protein